MFFRARSGRTRTPSRSLAATFVRSWATARWRRSLRNVPSRLQTLEDSFSDECGGDVHGRSTVGVPPASRPWVPYRRVPRPVP
eukprot:4164830-Pyramimonas_sp.AAC.1